MKIKSLLLVAAIAFSGTLHGQWKKSQTWSYSFGTTKGSFERKEEKVAVSISDAKKAGFVPVATNASAAGVYIGANSNGSFQLNGDESLTAKIGEAGLTRFSVANIATASDVVKLSMNLRFNDNSGKGTYSLAIGSDKAKLFNPKWNGSVWRSNSEVFTNIIWSFSATSPQITFAYREGSDAAKNTLQKTIDRTTFVKGNDYRFEVYCNNSSKDQKYKVGNTEYNLPSATYHIWVNDKKIESDFPKSIEVDGDQGITAGSSIALETGSALNSFSFSTNNGSPESKGEATISKINMVYATK
jgi:hypothetical protein